MTRLIKIIQTVLFYFLAAAMVTTAYAGGCTFSFSTRDNAAETTDFQPRHSEPVIVRDGEQVHP